MKRRRFMPDSQEEVIGFRWTALVYRTTRALLLCRRLIAPGELLPPLQEINRAIPVDPSTLPLSLLGELDDLPALPTGIDDAGRLANAHLGIAILLGIDPNDEVLHWFSNADLFLEFCPSFESLQRFEAELVEFAGKALIQKGRLAALKRLERVFGTAAALEKSDWAKLPQHYVNEITSTSTDDDRTLMVHRLEGLLSRARASLDTRLELSILRALASIQGLTFQEGDKSMKELALAFSQQPKRSSEAARLSG